MHLSGGHVDAGSWHHVAMVVDGVQGKARLVLDGEVVDEISVHGSIPIRPNLDLVVGTWCKKNQAFCGELDSIRLWNKALTPDELHARVTLASHAKGSGS